MRSLKAFKLLSVIVYIASLRTSPAATSSAYLDADMLMIFNVPTEVSSALPNELIWTLLSIAVLTVVDTSFDTNFMSLSS